MKIASLGLRGVEPGRAEARLGAGAVAKQLGDEFIPRERAGCGEIEQPTNDRRLAVFVAHRITTRPVGLNGVPHIVERGLERRYRGRVVELWMVDRSH